MSLSGFPAEKKAELYKSPKDFRGALTSGRRRKSGEFEALVKNHPRKVKSEALADEIIYCHMI